MRGAVADGLLLLGLALLTVAVYGAVRLDDVYRQLHAASKAALPGVAALLASAAVAGGASVAARAALAIALLTVTTPVAAHAIGRAAHERGEELHRPDAVDES